MKTSNLLVKTIIALTLTFCITGCKTNDDFTEPVAIINTSDVLLTNKLIQFKSNSTNGGTSITSWQWTFENGTPAISNEENPTVSFSTKGKHKVSLTVTNSVGSSTITETYAIIGDCVLYDCEKFIANKKEDIVYGLDRNYHIMNIYTPEGDDRIKTPTILLNGGGNYTGSNLDNLNDLADKLTSYGFVVAVARYRNRLDDNGTKTLMRGMADSKAAVRFLRANATDYNIDTDQIFLGGWSSGAYNALVHAYWQETDPSQQLMDLVINNGWIKSWEGEQGNRGFSSDVKAVINLAGSMYGQEENFKNDLWINTNEVPMFAVYGENDNNLPCGAIQVDNSTNWEFGPCVIHERLTSLNITSELKVLTNGTHSAPRELAHINNYLPDLVRFIVALL